MKRIDYNLPRQLFIFASCVFIPQLFVELVGERKPEFYWVFPMSAGIFAAACAFVLYALIMNSIKTK